MHDREGPVRRIQERADLWNIRGDHAGTRRQ